MSGKVFCKVEQCLTELEITPNGYKCNHCGAEYDKDVKQLEMPIPGLRAYSDEALKDELKVREEKRKARRRDDLKMNRDMVEQYVETLLLFVPKHDRTSCSDEKPCNTGERTGRLRCKRCQLLHVLRNKKTMDNLYTTVYLEVKYEEKP